MRTGLACLIATLALLAPPAARGDAPAAAFDGLRAELGHRRDLGFGGHRDGAAGRRRAAVLRSLARIDRVPDSLRGALEAAARIEVLLGRAYPPEFLPGAPATDLGPLVDGCLDSLAAEAEDRETTMGQRAQNLTERGQSRVEALDARASWYGERARERHDLRRPRIRALLSMARLIARGDRIADRDPGLPDRESFLTMDFDDGGGHTRFEAAHPKVVVYDAGDGFLLTADWVRQDGTWRLHLLVPGVDGVERLEGPDLYTPGFEGYLERSPPWPDHTQPQPRTVRYTFGTGGKLVLNNYDRKHRMYGGFGFTALGDDGTPLPQVDGFFNVFDVEEVP